MVVAKGECIAIELESFTQGARQNAAAFGLTSFLLINVGACIPEPAAPWQPEHPLLRYRASPSLAVPCPSGSSFPVGLMAISQARISSALGARPTLYVGDCVQAISPITSNGPTSKSLGKAIVNAPVGGDAPGLHAVVGAWHTE